MAQPLPAGSSHGPAPTLCFVLHANGLCREVWRPFVQELSGLLRLQPSEIDALQLPHRPEVRTVCLGGRLHLVLVDLLGHGRAPALALSGEDTDWAPFARQLQELAAECAAAAAPRPLGERCVVGHSLGGGAALVAQAACGHQLFARMFLFEPMYLFVDELTQAHLGLRGEPGMQRPLVKRTMARRDEWATAEKAMADFSGKRFFASWDPRALQGYVDGGLLGTGPVRLACSPLTEGSLFASGAPLSLVQGLRSASGDALKGCSIEVAMGTGASPSGQRMWTPEVADLLFAALRPRPSVSVVDGGHMWPLEQPAQFAAAVAQQFGWLAGSRL